MSPYQDPGTWYDACESLRDERSDLYEELERHRLLLDQCRQMLSNYAEFLELRDNPFLSGEDFVLNQLLEKLSQRKYQPR